MSDIPPADPHAANAGAPVVSGRAAAQGRTGARTFMILVVSLVLLIVVFGALLIFHAQALRSPNAAGGGPGVGGQEAAPAAAARSFHAPQPSPKQAPPGAPSTTGG